MVTQHSQEATITTPFSCAFANPKSYVTHPSAKVSSHRHVLCQHTQSHADKQERMQLSIHNNQRTQKSNHRRKWPKQYIAPQPASTLPHSEQTRCYIQTQSQQAAQYKALQQELYLLTSGPLHINEEGDQTGRLFSHPYNLTNQSVPPRSKTYLPNPADARAICFHRSSNAPTT